MEKVNQIASGPDMEPTSVGHPYLLPEYGK